MPSITFWNRLEPRPRAGDLTDALAARVRDPAWFLARQWQLGEFRGEDAGSPAYLTLRAELSPLYAWRAEGAAAASALPAGAPLEPVVTAEPWSPDDLVVAVQLGQQLERFLDRFGVLELRTDFLDAYPIGDGPGDDPASARLRALWRGRAIDGAAVYLAGLGPDGPSGEPPGVPPSIDPSRWGDAQQAIQQLVEWAAEVHGPIGTADPAAWRPDRLDHALRVHAAGGSPATPIAVELRAVPGAGGDLAWHGFDRVGVGAPPAGVPVPPVRIVERAVFPGPVKFRGMPSARFWDFEDGRVDFGDLRPDRRNLATLLLADFMLVHGTDWYVVSFEQPVGTTCRSTIAIVDVFGGTTAIPRADAAGGWSMFSTAGPDGTFADTFVVPDSAAAALDGPALEQVRFLRDDSANLVWAVEHSVEGPLGAAVPAAADAPVEPAPSSDAPLAYRVQSHVPAHWIPFQPVRLAPTDQIALERAALLGPTGAVPPAPRGRILQPSSLAGAPYRVREEEVPREGRRVLRRARRARGVDGRTYVWVARARGVGTGEGYAGLRFDRAVETVPPST